MSNIFDQMLDRYEIRTIDDYTNALHEVMQQITLAGLCSDNRFYTDYLSKFCY